MLAMWWSTPKHVMRSKVSRSNGMSPLVRGFTCRHGTPATWSVENESDGSRIVIRRSRSAMGRNTILDPSDSRSEEHTSELQSHSDLVCRLLLEKKKK